MAGVAKAQVPRVDHVGGFELSGTHPGVEDLLAHHAAVVRLPDFVVAPRDEARFGPARETLLRVAELWEVRPTDRGDEAQARVGQVAAVVFRGELQSVHRR